MKRIVLFRFHKNADVCSQRIRQLKNLNPDIEIYGLGEHIDGIEQLYDAGLEHLYTVKNKTTRWKWLHGDLAIQQWYNDYGHTVEFDYLHVIEWDFVLTVPLEEAYPNISQNTVYLTGVIPISEARKHGWGFVTGSRIHLVEMVHEFAEKHWSDVDEPVTCLFPGTSMPRSYFDKLNESMKIPEICNDEIRTGIFADAMGFKIKDTGFYDGWETNNANKTFNCKRVEVDQKTIDQNDSVQAFHPVREPINQLTNHET